MISISNTYFLLVCPLLAPTLVKDGNTPLKTRQSLGNAPLQHGPRSADNYLFVGNFYQRNEHAQLGGAQGAVLIVKLLAQLLGELLQNLRRDFLGASGQLTFKHFDS